MKQLPLGATEQLAQTPAAFCRRSVYVFTETTMPALPDVISLALRFPGWWRRRRTNVAGRKGRFPQTLLLTLTTTSPSSDLHPKKFMEESGSETQQPAPPETLPYLGVSDRTVAVYHPGAVSLPVGHAERREEKPSVAKPTIQRNISF